MPIAAAAYSDDPNMCLTNIAKYWQSLDNGHVKPVVFGQYSSFCESFNDTCAGLIILDNSTQLITIVFRGTPSYEEFFEHSFNFVEMVPFSAGGKVSKQMFDGFNKIWTNSGIKNVFLALKNQYPYYTFNFVGHSLGGAMASLAAATVVSTGILPSKNVYLYTFGQPKTGDKKFANAVNSIVTQANGDIHSFRVIHNHDIIPHFPPLFGTVYYQHISEMWYPNDMGENASSIDCSKINGEDPKCSNSINFDDLKGNEHKFYYGREVSVYGINGCPDLATSGKTTMAYL
uniref:Fungal lipase-like domain-containing protein n=1 Tax=Panagrolaimus superbus TaxID=310955 RepID=A0A914YVS9_9BILA